ncbi:MAG TPA: HAD family hydrolase [Candidatus Binatia bacterium]|nr:HAD family hydrolase [Candidatus Binatia bacterium]
MGRIEAIVFDVDNTLVDYYTMKMACVDAALDKMIARGLPVTDKREASQIVDDVFRNFTWEDQKLFWHVAQYAGVTNDVTLERFAQLGKTTYRRRQRDFLKPYEGVIETLTLLREQKIDFAILSDAPRLKVFDRLCDADLEHYFEDRVIGGDDNTEFRKPSPTAFTRVLRMLNRTSPQGVLMVGDQPVRDIIGGKQYGFVTAWAKYGYIHKTDEAENGVKTRADYVLEQFSDLAAIVKT